MSKNLLRLLAIVLAFGLIAAACGDDDTSSSGDDSSGDDSSDDGGDDSSDDGGDDATDDGGDDATDDGGDDDMSDIPEDWPESITFGFVPSQDQATLQDNIAPFISVLEEALGIGVDGVVTTDYTGLVTSMGTDQTDLGAFGPFGYTLGKDEFGNIEPLIQSVRFGSATYHGQWFTNDASICEEGTLAEATALENHDGEIVQVPALEAVALQVGVQFGDDGPEFGKINDNGDEIGVGWSCIGDLSAVAGGTVAFTTETSTSGYLFPALELTELGIDPATGVNPVFTGGHDAAVTAVYDGSANFGLSFDDARSTIDDVNADVGEKVIVFSITEEIPNDVVAVRTALPESLKTAIYDAIAAYLDTEEGEAVFDEIYSWTDIAPASDSDFDIVREAAAALGITEPPG
ncbi:MAG: phosphonate ABC transporter substrate-binding protein [Acidimicrobiales bacterium]|nr:MAG: phosphonate ABC transporter substrate-binding protein [Acidimicrobiales bacterium]